MTGRKKNIYAWRLVALAAVLVVGCLAVSMGTAYARYREEVDGTLGIQAKKPAQVYLYAGTDPQAPYVPGVGMWEEGENGPELSFLVTNTKSDDKIPGDSQRFRLRVMTSLSGWQEDTEGLLRLLITQGEETETVEAQVTRILPDTPLYTEFGEGWLFTFLDENGQELFWTLDGGTRSAVAMQLILENVQIPDASLMKLQVLGDMSQN